MQLINYGIRDWAAGWRLSLGLAIVPALVLTLGQCPVPALVGSWYNQPC